MTYAEAAGVSSIPKASKPYILSYQESEQIHVDIPQPNFLKEIQELTHNMMKQITVITNMMAELVSKLAQTLKH